MTPDFRSNDTLFNAFVIAHKVLQRDPGHPATHDNLAQRYTERRQYAHARWEYQAVELNPKLKK